jgi:hypothetical protein
LCDIVLLLLLCNLSCGFDALLSSWCTFMMLLLLLLASATAAVAAAVAVDSDLASVQPTRCNP